MVNCVAKLVPLIPLAHIISFQPILLPVCLTKLLVLHNYSLLINGITLDLFSCCDFFADALFYPHYSQTRLRTSNIVIWGAIWKGASALSNKVVI